MAFCGKCGKEIDDEAVICVHCGSPTERGKQGSSNNSAFKDKSNSMFSSMGYDEPPKSIEDCKQQDSMTVNLWSWARNTEKIGSVLVILEIIVGFYMAYVSGSTPQITYSGQYSNDFNLAAFFMTLFTYFLYAIIVYCSYHVLALLIGSLARIVQSTKTTAKFAEWQAMNGGNNQNNNTKTNTEQTTQYTETASNTWVCNCGTRNQPAAQYCKSCGKKRE